jgi:DNA-binding MarR family transcriptional regulator
MSVSQHAPPRSVAPLPDDIDSPRAKLVYLYLSVDGEQTLSDLRTTLGLPKITLLSVLGSLSSSGHIDRENGCYVVT